jgi:hypothetical protein
MARKVGVEFPSALCRLINRGDGREEIFRDDRDRTRFLDCFAESPRFA